MKSLNWSGIALKEGVSKLENVPKGPLHHIAIVGRSNVGKSSLINHLARRKHLAKTSKTAGKTRRLDFYLIPDQFFLVDLPGYGYARVGSSLKVKWSDLLEGYLNHPSLHAIIFLLDGRHDPSAQDLQFWQWLAARGLKSIIVLTKCDKVKLKDRKEQFGRIAAALNVEPEELIPYDIYSNGGRVGLDKAIGAALWD